MLERAVRSACGFIIIYALSASTPASNAGRSRPLVYTEYNPREANDEAKKDERLCPPSASPRQERIGALIFTYAFSMRIRHADASLTVFQMASDMRYSVRYIMPSRNRPEIYTMLRSMCVESLVKQENCLSFIIDCILYI